jgi:hypothetical protein
MSFSRLKDKSLINDFTLAKKVQPIPEKSSFEEDNKEEIQINTAQRKLTFDNISQ